MKSQKISIIIPTYNEEKHIVEILHCLKKQTLQPYEIIIADDSTDDTRKITTAQLDGWPGKVHIIDGGKKSVGKARTMGGEKATGDILLFLDCDTVFPPDFLAKAVAEFMRKQCVVAITSFNYDSKHPFDLLIGGFMNLATQLVQRIYACTHGFAIMCTKKVFDQIKGFDDNLKMGEDFDFGFRANQHGKFRVLTSTKIRISPRRLHEEGRFNLCWKLIRSTTKVLLGGKITLGNKKFSYKFGKHKE